MFGVLSETIKLRRMVVYLPTFPNSDAVPRPPEKGLGPSSKGTGASTNEAESLPSHISTLYPAENALFPVVQGGRRHFLIPHKPLLFQILQFLVDFNCSATVLASRLSKCPECFSMREISPRMWETRDFSSNAGDSRIMWQVYGCANTNRTKCHRILQVMNHELSPFCCYSQGTFYIVLFFFCLGYCSLVHPFLD